jgi:hypothetical protein
MRWFVRFSHTHNSWTLAYTDLSTQWLISPQEAREYVDKGFPLAQG